jgi:hypothetical protein
MVTVKQLLLGICGIDHRVLIIIAVTDVMKRLLIIGCE